MTAVIAKLLLIAQPEREMSPDTLFPDGGLSILMMAWDSPVAVPDTAMECGEPGALSVTTILALEQTGELPVGV